MREMIEPATVRAALQSGALSGAALLEHIASVPPHERDGWVDDVLGLEEAPPDIAQLPRGAVPYLPAGVEEIVAMVRELPLRADDVFVDLGSGLGRVVMLAHLLSGASARGHELQEPLVRQARARAEALGLNGVSFELADIANAELEGSVFFMYAPCNGPSLIRLLHRLESLARRKPIVVCAVDVEFPDERWLRPKKTSSLSLVLYESCVPGVAARR